MPQIASLLATVTTAGTPVRFTADETLRAYRLEFFPKVGNTGRTVVGVANLNKSSMANVICELGAAAATTTPASQVLESDGAYRLSDFWADADVSGEKVLMVAYTR